MKPGIIDIGSNSVRLCWLNDTPHAGILPEERLRYSRLGENETESGLLNDSAVNRTVAAVKELMAEAQANDVEILRISATSALREAVNRQAVVEKMEADLSSPVCILSENEEARYSYEGAIYGLPQDRRIRVVMDIGGGSTELCWGSGENMAASVPVGAVRLYESADKIGGVHKALAPLVQNAPKGDITLIGVGGTLTTMAAIFEQITNYDARSIHHLTYGSNAMTQLNTILKSLTVEERRGVPGMAASRADILPYGLDIALAVMHDLFTRTVTVSTTDLLFGQLLDLTEKA